MKAENIKVGMILKIKNECFANCVHADGSPFESQFVTVSAITSRKGYSVLWIRTAYGDTFKPSDFQRALGPEEHALELSRMRLRRQVYTR